MRDAPGGSARPLTALEETRLVSGAKNGDERSFEALVDRFMGPAIRVAMGYVKNREDAVDMAQEAFCRAHASLDRFRDGEPFAPWFFRILRNACLNYLDKRRRRRAVSIHQVGEDGESAWELADPTTLAPADRAEIDEAQRQFEAALAKLPLKHREIILLRHVEELEYAAIAEVLGIPVGTVMSRLFHARRKLRELLLPYLEGRT